MKPRYCRVKPRQGFFESNDFSYLRVGLEGNAEATDFVMILTGFSSVTIVCPDVNLVEPLKKQSQNLKH